MEDKQNNNEEKIFQQKKAAAEISIQLYNNILKFEYTFMTLIFGTLVLSLKSLDKTTPFYISLLLIGSWILYLITGYIGAERLQETYNGINILINANSGNVLNPNNTPNSTIDKFEKGNKKLNESNDNYKKQKNFYYCGICLNVIYVAITIFI